MKSAKSGMKKLNWAARCQSCVKAQTDSIQISDGSTSKRWDGSDVDGRWEVGMSLGLRANEFGFRSKSLQQIRQSSERTVRTPGPAIWGNSVPRCFLPVLRDDPGQRQGSGRQALPRTKAGAHGSISTSCHCHGGTLQSSSIILTQHDRAEPSRRQASRATVPTWNRALKMMMHISVLFVHHWRQLFALHSSALRGRQWTSSHGRRSLAETMTTASDCH